MTNLNKALSAAVNAINIELTAMAEFAKGIEKNITPALEILLGCEGHVVLTGLGKSGIVGSKIAATLASTGTPAFFMHTVEAMHGDSGALTPGDVLVLISNSGETHEVNALAVRAKSWGLKTIAITKNANSTLVKNTDTCILIHFDKEADPLNLAPTTSTTLVMATGDALASALMVHHEFSEKDFGKYHPGGELGKVTNK